MTLPTSSSTFIPSFDDFLDLPPIQDPSLNSISLLSGRPSPLEPRPNDTADLDAQAKSTTLSSRQKALAQAQPLGFVVPSDLDSKPTESNDGDDKSLPSKPARPDPEQARKKAKLGHNEQIADFVHLPKLQKSKPKDEKRPPFQPVAVLNQLNEPPPSAGLFPPITPRAAQSQETQGQTDAVQPQHLSHRAAHAPGATHNEKTEVSIKPRTPKERKKKVYLRDRVKWTEEETEQLVKGVAIYGMGRWKHILEHPEFDFHSQRTHVDLKDKFRVLFPPKAPQKWVRSMPEHISEDEGEFDSPHKPSPKTHLRARKRVWTAAEDKEMDRGFRIYGYKWELMAKDPDLRFDNRTGAQIRDRFRLRFPDLYAQQTSAVVNSKAVAEDEKEGEQSKPSSSKRSRRRRVNDATVDHTQGRSGHDKRTNISKANTNSGTGDNTGKPSTKSKTSGTLLSPIVAPSSSFNGTATAASDWPSRLLNDTENDTTDDPDPRLPNDLSQYEWGSDGAGGSLTLPPPLSWEDMVPASAMFDIT